MSHAATPHWLLFVLFAGGITLMIAAVVTVRRGLASRTAASASMLVGGPLAVFGLIGLVELQVVGRAPPEIVDIYPLLSLLVG